MNSDTVHRSKTALRVTWIGLAVNCLLTAVKFAAGVLGRSQAMIADSLHSLSDLASDIVVLFGFKLADRPIDETHDYGHGKFETLATVIIGLLLLFAGTGILYAGIKNITGIINGTVNTMPGWVAFFGALLSIIVKEWLYQITIKKGKEIKSNALIANAWHHRTDALSSVGALLGIGGAILLGGKWRLLDPAAAAIVALLIIKVGFSIVKKSVNELLDASLCPDTEKLILSIIHNTAGVKDSHQLRTRALGNSIAIDIHVQVNQTLNIKKAHDISTNVEKALRKHFGQGTFISIHIEPFNNK